MKNDSGMNEYYKPWLQALLAFGLCAVLLVGFVKINPSPFELAKESVVSFAEAILLLACIFASFAIGVMQAIEQVVIWIGQAKTRKGG